MSEYSLDSLESVEDVCDSLEKYNSVNSDNDDNLGTIKSDDRSSKNTLFQLNSTLTTLSQIKDNMTEANCTVREDRCKGTTGVRNSIITSGRGFARRQQECRATWEEPWLCIRKRNDFGERRSGEGDENRRRCRRVERCSLGARNSSSKCSLRDNGGGMRVDKKLGNVLIPWIRGPARTTSYLELYRRRFNVPKYPRIQSPEGSTLSICGDSQLEELSLDEGCSSLPGTSRDDGSELSFYRRFVEDHAVRVTCPRRSCEVLRQGITSNTVSLEEQCERSVSDSKLKKPTYRPYTIEEYRSLSVPRPDRSLGPDKDDVQAKIQVQRYARESKGLFSLSLNSRKKRSTDMFSLKVSPDRVGVVNNSTDTVTVLVVVVVVVVVGVVVVVVVIVVREWLMRRRSYGDSVSARNRQQILQRTRRFKSRRAIVQKCFLPSLKDWDATTSKNRESSRILETNNVTQESLLKHPVMCPKKGIATDETSTFRENEMLEKTLSFESSLNLYASCEDLERWQQCHLQETELADRFMRQTLNS
ncbi:hypothetical protein ALC56_13762 [Trachymyrmex septentrionalis]|uniref:Uncharacterized protein n=1 Tax=Trachymyrmex septentrionalis TaxID=34720 RepID=A0A195EVT9_9HYME|nr:hypothetical protein ALC56_13762 [Trachymyrmex septentrionalis]